MAILGILILVIICVIFLCCICCWWRRKVAAFEQAVNDKIMGAATDALGMGEQQQQPPQTQMMPMGQPGMMQPMPHMGGMPMGGATTFSSSTTTTTTNVIR